MPTQVSSEGGGGTHVKPWSSAGPKKLQLRLTLARRLAVRPLLDLHVVPGTPDDVLVLEGGVVRNVEGVPGLRQGHLRAVFGLLLDLEHHLALVQVDVLKVPGGGGAETRGGGASEISLDFWFSRPVRSRSNWPPELEDVYMNAQLGATNQRAPSDLALQPDPVSRAQISAQKLDSF